VCAISSTAALASPPPVSSAPGHHATPSAGVEPLEVVPQLGLIAVAESAIPRIPRRSQGDLHRAVEASEFGLASVGGMTTN
jgi:hypothetical protein